jgi:hypothetical protein
VSARIAVAIFRINMVGRFWKPCIGQTVGGDLDLMLLIGGTEERAAIQWEMSMWLRKRGDEKTPKHYMFALKMATTVFTETLDNFQHSTRLIPESRRCTYSCSKSNYTSWMMTYQMFL